MPRKELTNKQIETFLRNVIDMKFKNICLFVFKTMLNNNVEFYDDVKLRTLFFNYNIKHPEDIESQGKVGAFLFYFQECKELYKKERGLNKLFLDRINNIVEKIESDYYLNLETQIKIEQKEKERLKNKILNQKDQEEVKNIVDKLFKN